ncbi:SirB2 family protein [Parahaliea mediterranea]|uniref:SirB2 family protein n=1 Tax=Parahaliea mediterranea TaxID=651086 RepID=A0A939IKK1_9GAMM|nr:SirB2 family protein [Parahaliea mediterranea]MBN7798839.1 SirB2 family protein [Parahaliea mediterranea]
MSYLLLKHIHLSSVGLSFILFLFRGGLKYAGSSWLDRPLLRIAPHVVDTVLLVSAICLAVLSRQYPFVHAWLTAKVLLLVLYIVLGSLALKRGRTPAVRGTCFVLAVAVFGLIVSVALTRDSLGVLSSLLG